MTGKIIAQIVNNMRLTKDSLLLHKRDNKIYKYINHDSFNVWLKSIDTNNTLVTSHDDVEYIKLFVKSPRGTFELRYSDYDKVRVGDTVEISKFIYKVVKPDIPSQVYITGIPISFLKHKYAKEIDISKIQKGTVIDKLENKYKVEIGNNIVILRRNNFQLAEKNNFKKVAVIK